MPAVMRLATGVNARKRLFPRCQLSNGPMSHSSAALNRRRSSRDCAARQRSRFPCTLLHGRRSPRRRSGRRARRPNRLVPRGGSRRCSGSEHSFGELPVGSSCVAPVTDRQRDLVAVGIGRAGEAQGPSLWFGGHRVSRVAVSLEQSGRRPTYSRLATTQR